jgi:hypothetical protein
VSPVTSFAQTQPEVSPVTSSAQTQLEVSSVEVSKEQIYNVQKMANVVKELDKKLNMEDLSQNSEKDINKLSKEAKEFYNLYVEVSASGEGDVAQALVLLGSYYNTINTESSTQQVEGQVSTMSIGGVYNYYLSNQQVRDIIATAGVNGGFWAVLSAAMKHFAKSPTLLTAMIVALPALGAATLNACNRYAKGVVITDVRVGTFHNFSCAPRR